MNVENNYLFHTQTQVLQTKKILRQEPERPRFRDDRAKFR